VFLSRFMTAQSDSPAKLVCFARRSAKWSVADRPNTLVAYTGAFTGWRMSAAFPIIGLEPAAKARRTGEGSSIAICRGDYPDQARAQVLLRDQGSAISHMAVGTTLGLAASVRPVQKIIGFLIAKSSVSQQVVVKGQAVPFNGPTDASKAERAVATPVLPTAAGCRSGANGAADPPCLGEQRRQAHCVHVVVIARDPAYLPYIAAALTPARVGAHYGQVLRHGRRLRVEQLDAPGLSALNDLALNPMDGGVLASTWIDPVAKGARRSHLVMSAARRPTP